MEIWEICLRAKAEGLSYGQYVLRHAEELRGKRPAPRLRKGEKVCAFCSRVFVSENPRSRFCRTSCRVAWNMAKKRSMLRERECRHE